MRLTLDTVVRKGRLVADDERYHIHDYDLDGLTVSPTELKRGKETRGLLHSSNAEVYFFPGGDAEMEVGEDRFKIYRGAVMIPKGEVHRVINRSLTSDLLSASVFPGRREDSRARYERSLVGRGKRAAPSRRAPKS